MDLLNLGTEVRKREENSRLNNNATILVTTIKLVKLFLTNIFVCKIFLGILIKGEYFSVHAYIIYCKSFK